MTTMNIFDMADLWSNSLTTFTAIKMDVTDTASASGSLLMDLQVGGVSQFNVRKDGKIDIPNAGGTGALLLSGGFWGQIDAFGFALKNNNGTFVLGASGDTILARDAADTLAQRRGTNAQAFRVYNTFTDASNFERFELGYVSNVATLRHAYAGTGASRNLRIAAQGNANILFSTVGSDVAAFNSGGLTFQTDNTYDIGANGANRPRDIWAGRNIYAQSGSVGATVVYTGWIGLGAFNSASLGQIYPISDGVLRLTNGAGTDFNRLQFGGTTSSFPALKRNSTALETKLADDSAYAPHAMQYLDINDGMTAPGAATGRARIYVDSADGDLKCVFADGTVKTIVTDT